MISQCPKGLGQGTQDTDITIEAIEIPDRGEETYESYVKCVRHIITFWFTPNENDASESEDGSRNSHEESAMKKPGALKRKMQLIQDRSLTREKLAEMLVEKEQQGVNVISKEIILENHVADADCDMDEVLQEVTPEDTKRAAKKGKVQTQHRFVEYKGVTYDLQTLKDQYTVRVCAPMSEYPCTMKPVDLQELWKKRPYGAKAPKPGWLAEMIALRINTQPNAHIVHVNIGAGGTVVVRDNMK
jgi:hypothetical protein